MALFDNKLKIELQETKQQLIQLQKSTTNMWSELDSFMAREKSSSNISSLTADLAKIGDPYFTNIYYRKAIDKASAMISSVDIDIVDANGKPLPPSSPIKKLFSYINEDDNQRDFIYEIVRSLKRFGKCHIKLSTVKRVGNIPVDMEILQSDKIKAKKDANGLLSYWEYEINNKTVSLPKEEVLFFKYKHPSDPYDGIAPGSCAIKEILLDYYANVYNIKNMKNGAQGKGVWVDASGSPLSATQKAEAQWAVDNEFNKGVDGAGESVVLSRNLSWVRTSETNRDMEYITLTNKMRDDILNALDMPKVLFLSADSTFTNLKEAKKMLWQQTLLSDIKLIEDVFNNRLLDGEAFIRFKIEDIPELVEDVSTKMTSAQQLYAMNVPMSVINEVLNLGLPDYEGMDSRQSDMMLSIDNQEEKNIKLITETRKQQLIENEKRINTDAFFKDLELKQSINTMLTYEKQLSNRIQSYYSSKYKEVEEWLQSNMPEEEKSILSNVWLDKLKSYLKSLINNETFFSSIKSVIERTFNQGVYRTYSGIGADFHLNNERAIQYLTQRGLKLKDSPDVVIESIINHLSKDSFTIDELAKTISTVWKDASLARAKNIAITETTAAYNGGRIKGMQELGIKQMGWINSHDDKVRHSHSIDQVVNVGEKFTLADGYQVAYPGDGDAEHSCNCRCVVVSKLD